MQPNRKPTRARALLMNATLLAALGTVIAGCASSPAPVNKPCGVIEDSLGSVSGKTRNDQRRIDRHFERGFVAGCWTRDAQ